MAILDEAVRLLPDAMWWLKADGVDVVSGISESVRLEWSGDVDLNDGEVEKVRVAYLNRLKFIENIGMNRSNDQLQHDLTVLEKELKEDLTFLSAGELPCKRVCAVHVSILSFCGLALEDANGKYCAKVAAGNTTHQVLFALGWTIDEMSRLNEDGRKLLVQCKVIMEQHATLSLTGDIVGINIPRQLADLRSRCTQFVKGVTRSKRTAATHLMVFMISHERRDRKPYALPVQCIPYVGMSDAKMRCLANKIIEEMVKRKMKIAGSPNLLILMF